MHWLRVGDAHLHALNGSGGTCFLKENKTKTVHSDFAHKSASVVAVVLRTGYHKKRDALVFPVFIALSLYILNPKQTKPRKQSKSWALNCSHCFTFTVVNQYYEAEVVSEYVIRGNTAVLKCNIPSFVADFVRVEAWVGSDNKEYIYADDYGIFDGCPFWQYRAHLNTQLGLTTGCHMNNISFFSKTNMHACRNWNLSIFKQFKEHTSR